MRRLTPDVKVSKQPDGDGGVQNTLDKVAEAAIRGGEDPRVRSHVTYVLKACGWPTSNLARMECLTAENRTLHHVDDPVNAEFVPEAWTMMPNHVTGEPPMFVAEDCDGLTLRLLAMFLAAGIPSKVVGYWFANGRHVAGQGWDNAAGKWLDVEPSHQTMAIGQTTPSLWRQERELPSMTITCDSDYCPTDTPPIAAPVENFVAVGALPGAEVTTEVLTALGEEMIALATSLQAKWDHLQETYGLMRKVASESGIHTVGDLAAHGWTAENQQSAIDAGVMAAVAIGALREAANGDRGVWPEVTPSGETTFAIERKPTDTLAVALDANGNPGLVDLKNVPYHASAPDNSIGNPIVIAGLIAVVWVAWAYAIGKVVDGLTETAKVVARDTAESRVYACLKHDPPCTQAEVDDQLAKLRGYNIDQTKADTEKQNANNKAPGPLDGLNNIVYLLGALGTIYGGLKVIEALTAHKATARAQ